MVNLSTETIQEVQQLATELIAHFTPPEYIPGCEVMDISDLNLYATNNGWIEAVAGRHNQQRCRWRGQFAVEVGDYVDVLYFASYRLFFVLGQGGAGAINPPMGWPYTTQILTVDPGGNADWTTAAAAIAAANVGDVVEVGADLTENPTINKAITFRGKSPSVVISGTLTISDDAVVENITIQDASSCIELSGTPTVRFNNVIVDGVSAGTGFTFPSGSTAELRKCESRNCGDAINSTAATVELYFGKYGDFFLSGAANSVTTFWTLKSGSINLAGGASQPTGWVIFETNNRLTNWDGTARFQLGFNTWVNDIVTTLGDPGDDNTLVTEAAIRTAISAISANVMPLPDKANIGVTEYADADTAFGAVGAGDLLQFGEGSFTTNWSGGNGNLPTGADLQGVGIDVTVLTDDGDSRTVDVDGDSNIERLTIQNTNANGIALYADTASIPKLRNMKCTSSGGGTDTGVYFNLCTGRAENVEFSGTRAAYVNATATACTCDFHECIFTGNIIVNGDNATCRIYGGLITGDILTASGNPTIELYGCQVTGSVTGATGFWYDSNGDIHVASDEAGLKERFNTIHLSSNYIEDDFNGSSFDAVWTFAGAPFATPSTQNFDRNSCVLLGSNSSIRAFLYRTDYLTSTAHYMRFSQNLPIDGAYFGYRYDDGTDNNYAESVIRKTVGVATLEVVSRNRVGGGAVTETVRHTIYDYPAWVTVGITLSGTQWSSWSAVARYSKSGPGTLGFGIGSGLTWTPARRGIVIFNNTTSLTSGPYIDQVIRY